MSLVRDARLFTQRVSAAPISGNIDNPEGGLDALMQVERERERVEQITAQFPFPKCVNIFITFLFQVMVCGNKIGWRQESRRVVVYTTDQVNINDKGAYQLINPREISPHQKKKRVMAWSRGVCSGWETLYLTKC